MATQGVNFTVADNQLGLTSGGSGPTVAVIGVSSAGTANQPFQSPQPGPFTTNFGYGPGPELAAYTANANGNNVVYVKVATSGAGTNTSVVHTGTGGSVVTVTGTPLDSYYPLVTVLIGGTIGTSGIQITVSLDAGRTVYATVNLLTATTYAVANTGLTLNFAAGTMVAGDTYAWVSQEPTWTDAGITSAIQSLRTLQGVTVTDILIAGVTASSNATNMDANATTLFNNKRFNRIIAAARDAVWGGTSTESEASWMTSIENDYANFQSTRVGITGGHYNFISPVSSDAVPPPAPLGCRSARRGSLDRDRSWRGGPWIDSDGAAVDTGRLSLPRRVVGRWARRCAIHVDAGASPACRGSTSRTRI